MARLARSSALADRVTSVSRSRPPSAPTREQVCGLVVELGEQARAATYERAWERDDATWRAVCAALVAAGEGRRPAVPVGEPPAWLTRLARERLATMATRTVWTSAFADVRALERHGLVDLDVDDTYVLAAVGGLGVGDAGGRARAVREDPELVERVLWRMFEVEGGGEVSLANVDKYSAREDSWQSAFLDLTGDGLLDRERVLTSALTAMNRDFSAYRAGWFARLYEALAPTLDELDRHQPMLRALIRSDITATVTFAVTRLRLLSKHGRVDDTATVPALGPAVLLSAKTTALSALRLTAEAATRSPATRAAAVGVAAAGLQHPHADVQRASAELLTAFDAADVLAAAADQLEPSVKRSLGFETATPAQAPGGPVHDVGWLRAMPAAVTRSDLLERTAALLEDASDAVELEAVLAGHAALADADLLRPLLKRATTALQRGPGDYGIPGWLRGQLARLVQAAAGDDPGALPVQGAHLQFLVARLDHVTAVLTGQHAPSTLLATPTSTAGWLDPAVLVDRLRLVTGTTGGRVERHDLIAALLRLHPDGRPDALRQLQTSPTGLPDDLGRAVMYALGGEPPAAARRRLRRPSAIEDGPVWVAAARTRSPFAADGWLAEQGQTGAGRSQPLDATVVLIPRPFTWTDHSKGVERNAMSWQWRIECGEARPRGHSDKPTCPDAGDSDPFRQSVEDFVGWMALTFPADAEHFLLTGLQPVLAVACSDEVSHDAVRVLDALGAHPGRLGLLAQTCLAAGLTASKVDQRARAVDSTHALHRQGRLTAADLGEGLVSIAGPANLTRWASSLRDLATADASGSAMVREALAVALPRLDTSARGLHALLELLLEEVLRQGAPTPAALVPWLAQLSGTSRAAKAARQLLARGDT